MASTSKTSTTSGKPSQSSQPQIQTSLPQQGNVQKNITVSGGYFEFDDGGCYAGDWVNGQAYGYGKCTGPQGKGEYSGTWKAGFEVSGVYTWPNGNTYAGQWLDGKRGGLGVEIKDNWTYKGEWIQGLKEKYGVKYNVTSEAKYEGAWIAGMQDGLGVETYVDESTYQGQWSKGMRHGLGVRKSVPRGIASIYHSTSDYLPNNPLRSSFSMPSGLSLKRNASSVSSHEALLYGSTLDNRKPDDSDRHKGGFVLIEKIKASFPTSTSHRLQRSRSYSLGRTISKRFKIRRSDSINGLNKLSQFGEEFFKSDPSNLCGSADTGKNSLVACSVDVNLASVVETYAGEWKNDKRCGFGISQRTDGLRYEGEWFNDKRCGYGLTVYQDKTKEEGKYRNNGLISSVDQKRRIFTKKKLKDRVEVSITFAKKAAESAYQKSELAMSKRSSAIAKAEEADEMAKKAHYFAEIAQKHAQKFYQNFAEKELERLQKETDNDVKISQSRLQRGESGDSHLSSWSGSSNPSSHKILQQSFPTFDQSIIDDNVFDNKLIEIDNKTISKPINKNIENLIKSTKGDSTRHDSMNSTSTENQKILLFGKELSVDDGAEFKTSKSESDTKVFNGIGEHHFKPPHNKNDRRDYFNSNPPDIPSSLQPLPNGFIPSFNSSLKNKANNFNGSNKTDIYLNKSHNFFTSSPSSSIEKSRFFQTDNAIISPKESSPIINMSKKASLTISNDKPKNDNLKNVETAINPTQNISPNDIFADRLKNGKRRYSNDQHNYFKFDFRNTTETGPLMQQPVFTPNNRVFYLPDRILSNENYTSTMSNKNRINSDFSSSRVFQNELNNNLNWVVSDNLNKNTKTLSNKNLLNTNSNESFVSANVDSSDIAPLPINTVPTIQNWLQENLIAIVFILINMVFTALFFEYWTT